MKLQDLKNKKILILGFGREGRDTFLFLRKLFPEKVLGIADKNKISNLKTQNSKIKLHLGKNYLKAIGDYDVIIKTPGISPKIFASQKLRKTSPKITSQAEIFFDNCPGKIVGITGTKGKGTTASLIYDILKAGAASKEASLALFGRRIKAHLIGNIGQPVLNYLFSATPKDVYVYELSSHQLQNLKKSPQIAVFLNIYQAHLDYYKSFKEYIKAKANIVKYQGKKDVLVYNAQDPIVRKIAQKSKARKIPYNSTKYEFITKIRNKISLVGKFNLENIMAATAVGKIMGISDRDIIKAVLNFKPLPYRLEYIGTYRGIKFYNDSLATVPDAVCRAIEALGNSVETIFLGGYEANVNYRALAKKVLASKIRNVILFPPSGKNIWAEITTAAKNKELPQHFWAKNMPEGVKWAYQQTQKGKIALLSCGSPSYGLFKNYKERGNLFKQYVKKLAKN